MLKIGQVVLNAALALLLLRPAWAQEAPGVGDLKPGDVLNQSNWKKAEGLLPPEILKHYQAGEYVNPIVDWPVDHFVWPPDFLEGCKRNEGRFTVSENGEILEKATGKPPAYIIGHPFPTIDASDPMA